MTPDEATLQQLYESLSRKEPAKVAECYCDDATFRDIAFKLTGREDIAAMWRLVCSKIKKVEFGNIRTESTTVKGHWACEYYFSKTGRFVRNEIDSVLTFRDGKILSHRDEASRWQWAKQAMGFPDDIVVTTMPIFLRWGAEKELREFRKNEQGGRAG